MALYQAFHRMVSHTAGNEPVEAGRAAATLDVSENTHPHFRARHVFKDVFFYFQCSAKIIAFGHDNHVHHLFPFLFLLQ